MMEKQHGFSEKCYGSGMYKEKQKYTNIRSMTVYTDRPTDLNRNDCIWKCLPLDMVCFLGKLP
jgi:hypothetical protein